MLKLETTVALVDDKKPALLAALSKIVAGTIGKPEQYVMVIISPAAIYKNGDDILDCKKARGSCVKPWSYLLDNSSSGGMVRGKGLEPLTPTVSR